MGLGPQALSSETRPSGATLRKLKSGYIEGNVASARAKAAAGYHEVGRWHRDRFVDGEWRDHVLTEVLRERLGEGPRPFRIMRDLP